MMIIDAHTGKEMQIGDTVDHDDGCIITLLDVRPGFFDASALIQIAYSDPASGEPVMRDGVTARTLWQPLHVRWTHPCFFLKHVGFLPT